MADRTPIYVVVDEPHHDNGTVLTSTTDYALARSTYLSARTQETHPVPPGTFDTCSMVAVVDGRARYISGPGGGAEFQTLEEAEHAGCLPVSSKGEA